MRLLPLKVTAAGTALLVLLACPTRDNEGNSSGGGNTSSSSSSGSSSSQSGSSSGASSGMSSGASSGASSGSSGNGSSSGTSGNSSGISSSSSGGSSSSMAQPPAAPALTLPAANQAVSNPVDVQGTVDVNASTVRVELRRTSDSMLLGSATPAVGSSGGFSALLTYTPQMDATQMALTAVASGPGGDSTPTTVLVTQAALHTLEVNLEQVGGTQETTSVVLWLGVAGQSPLRLLQTQTWTVTRGSPADTTPGMPLTFSVPSGDYVVRAFRDTNDDGLPQFGGLFGTEPQGHATVSVSSGTATVTVTLDAPMGVDAATGNADARIASNGPDARGPCQAPRALATANVGGASMGVASMPQVIMPDGQDLPMLNDGACDENNGIPAVAGSYDRFVGDDEYTAGTAVLPPAPAEFVIYWTHLATGLVHAWRDTIAFTQPLAGPTALTTPAPGTAITSLPGTVQWNAVSGATHYDVELFDESTSQGVFLQDLVAPTTVLTAAMVTDATPYQLRIRPKVAEPDQFGGLDVDSITEPPFIPLLVATTASDTVTVQGTVTNGAATTAPVRLEAWGCANQGGAEDPLPCSRVPHSAITLGSGGGAYSVVVLRSAVSGRGLVRAYVDLNNDGDRNDSEPSGSVRALDGTANITGADVTIYKGLVLLAPQDNATIASQPLVAWTPWEEVPGPTPPVYSYAVFFSPDNGNGGDFPATIVVLPPSTSSFSFANLPTEMRDAIALVAANTPMWMGPTQSTFTLASGTYQLGLAALACDYQLSDLDFYACMLPLLSDGGEPLATSAVRVTVP